MAAGLGQHVGKCSLKILATFVRWKTEAEGYHSFPTPHDGFVAVVGFDSRSLKLYVTTRKENHVGVRLEMFIFF